MFPTFAKMESQTQTPEEGLTQTRRTVRLTEERRSTKPEVQRLVHSRRAGWAPLAA